MIREFAPVLKQYIFKKSSRDQTTVGDFLMSRLWPYLVKRLKGLANKMTREQLEAKLAEYVHERYNCCPPVPSCIRKHVDNTNQNVGETNSLDHPMDYSTIVGSHAKDFFPGSRQWMFDRFSAWKETDSTMFVLISAAGMGKTSWAAKLVEDHEQQNIVAWHFCKFDQAAMSQPKRMLFSLASQLVTNVASYGGALAKVVKRSLAPDQKYLRVSATTLGQGASE